MSVHHLIETWAQATPDAIAIRDRQQPITYRKLNQRADRLAESLRALGVDIGAPVGLFSQRSATFVIGALGILKAGGAYVPVDPADPPTRLAMALQDSGCKCVVTQSSVAERLPKGNWQTIILEGDGSCAPREQNMARTKAVRAGERAYIIFTSGSTGRPKGVQITHANLLNLIHWHNRRFQVLASDRATLQASPGFDAAVWELWPYLAAGATVHIVEDSVRNDPKSLRDWMIEKGITISFLPTALAESMMDLSWPPETPLRFLLTGADVLHRYPPQGLPFAVINNYGPTECTVVATSGAIPSDTDSSRLPTIGRPIENVQIHVVDEQLRPVSAGTPGELLIGGAGVGRGYLNLPEITEQKFLPDFFSRVSGARLYRTGDLVRVEPDGQVAFLGRIDQQIKIRGYRIEPGEIEAAVRRYPSIRSSAVTAHSSSFGKTILVCYVVMKPDDTVDTQDLRSFLSKHLPDYMVPATFVKVAELPFTTNGKIDRSALPAPSPENVLSDDQFEAPRSGIESWLANLLIKLLGVHQISRNDNFFRLGGHSLLGAQLIAKIQHTFDVELSLRSLFDHPTVSGIATEISQLIHAKLNEMSDDEVQTVLESLSGEVTP